MRTDTLLVVALLVQPARAQWSTTDAEASRWYAIANVSALSQSATTLITATTPLPVMCALVWRLSSGPWGTIALQPMQSGVSAAHLIPLPTQASEVIEFVAFSWLPFGRAIFQSAKYTLAAGSTSLAIAPGSAASVALPTRSGVATVEVSSIGIMRASAALGTSEVLCSAVASAFAVSANPANLVPSAPSTPPHRHSLFRTDATSTMPSASLSGLSSATTYSIGGAFVAADLGVSFTHVASFSTLSAPSTLGTPPPPSASSCGTNLALASLGATISASSSFGGSWAAGSAIDGSISSAWSSAGDGNGAHITVQLPTAALVDSVGFYSRSMSDGTAIISAYDVSADGVLVAPCTVPDTASLHVCALPATQATSWRFDVTASTGGNVGAHSIEIYEACSTGRRLQACIPTSMGEGSGNDDLVIIIAVIGALAGALAVLLFAGWSWRQGRRHGVPKA